MFTLRMLSTRTWQSNLRRHHLCYSNILYPSAFIFLVTSLEPSVKSHLHTASKVQSLGNQDKTMENTEMEIKASTGISDDESWKSRPPYQTTTSNAHFDKKWTAHCHCGRVKYWLSRNAPLASKFCHCVDCQGLHGAPFQWAAIFEKSDLHFERGAEGLAFYHAPDRTTVHKLPCKVSCAYCHAPIMDEGRNMVLMFPGIIKFSDAEHKKLFDPQ
ncbi:Mss4-like protein [Hypomontagnella monticulosa]|nr:Mss4-like protein [Hypomontagnella monticulosa]